MSPVRLDFAFPRPRSRAGAALLFVGSCALAAASWEYRAAMAQAANLEQQLNNARQTQKAAERAAMPRTTLSDGAISSINDAIAKMNLPWDEIFGVFDADLPDNIALLSLEPDGGHQRIKVVAEAKTPDDMTAFIQTLGARRQLGEVTLVKHEVNDQDPNRTIRFVLEAHW